MEDKEEIDNLCKLFFSIFTNTHNRQPDWDTIYQLCIPEVLIIKKTGLVEEIYSIQTFVEPRKKILSDGTLTEFQETEIEEDTKITGHLAQRSSKYEKSGYLNNMHFHENGHKFFQFVKTSTGWKINAIIWQDFQAGNN